MKPNLACQQDSGIRNCSKTREGFTFVELLAVMVVITILAALVSLAAGSASRQASASILAADNNPPDQVATHEEAVATYQPCLNNLKQISSAFKLWASDHQGKFPFNVSTNEGGTMELCSRGFGQFDQSALAVFKQMSNALGSPQTLVCPADWLAKPADEFQNLQRTNVGYQLRTGSNITSGHPEQVLVFCPIHSHALYADGRVAAGPGPGPAYNLPSASELRARLASQDEVSARNLCIVNLRWIDGAKALWALEKSKGEAEIPTTTDLLPYLDVRTGFPVCPAGGAYNIGRMDQQPTCTIPGHSLNPQ